MWNAFGRLTIRMFFVMWLRVFWVFFPCFFVHSNWRSMRNCFHTEITKHIAPLGWAHVGLTGDYLWNMNSPFNPDRLRPLRKNSLRDAA